VIAFAHILGIPVEENLPYLVPAGGALLLLRLRARAAHAALQKWRRSPRQVRRAPSHAEVERILDGAPHARELSRLAELAVCVGANVQSGQIVAVSADVGQEPLARSVADSAYRHGARFVDVTYFDRQIQRSRLEHAATVTLPFVPSWYGARAEQLGEQRCASIGITGPVAPGLLDHVDADRIAADRLPEIVEMHAVVAAQDVNWTVVPGPNVAWACQVFPTLPPDAALAALWRDVAHIMRLDETDPVEAWNVRQDALETKSAQLTTAELDSIHFSGPGTDLTVGLLPGSRWASARLHTADRVTHVANLPSEEIFTTPDPARTEGHVLATRPVVIGGTMCERVRLEFAHGKVVRVAAARGAEHLAALIRKDAGAKRLGEIALVDEHSRIGRLGRTFFETLLDENAACHLALGSGYPFLINPETAHRCNASAIHNDVMIGTSELEITGIRRNGQPLAIMSAGVWRL